MHFETVYIFVKTVLNNWISYVNLPRHCAPWVVVTTPLYSKHRVIAAGHRGGDNEDNKGVGVFMRHDKGCKHWRGGRGPGARMTGIRHTREGNYPAEWKAVLDAAVEDGGTMDIM